MTDVERREAVRQFINKWQGKGNEEQDSQLFWIEFLSSVVDMENVTDRVSFEKKVIVDGHTKKIDVYIPETHTLIEQKSLGKSLDKKITNSGDIELTPYEQAKRYNDNLPYNEKARWIITSNFSEIWVYDMNMSVPEPIKVELKELRSKYSLFDFISNKEIINLAQEMEISVKAGEFVGLIYDALLKQYIDPNSKETLKSLNMLCVRLVFCLYAEDAHIFGNNGHMFHDYMNQYETKDMRKALIELFKTLDIPEDKRDKYDKSLLSKFPYVNGGLFADEGIEIPNFTDEIRNILLAKASEGFDWSRISPTIFGAVFESTLNPETRRHGGMHYTSIENIHKVIDPLFLDELKAELEEIESIQVEKTRKSKLEAFQNKLASLKWLDPACGSGNFLTETYISVRKLENRVIRHILDSDKKRMAGQIVLGDVINPIKVTIDQFYGLEINDFAVTVAKTALWIAESQMMKRTEDIMRMKLDFLPLRTNANIVECNALRIDWNDVIPSSELNYIMGNPPFRGMKYQDSNQKEDMSIVFKGFNNYGSLDYVASWHKVASEYIDGTKIKVAFVSTNSITQGEQVAILWKPLFEENGIKINYAYRTFRWDSEANIKAHVHCVIVGFSQVDNGEKLLYDSSGQFKKVSNINGYLCEAPDIFITTRTKPLSNVPKVVSGNKPVDGDFLKINKEDYNDFITKEPKSIPYIKKLVGGYEFINNVDRYVLWLVGVSPDIIKSMPLVYDRVKKVREARLAMIDEGARKLADTPTTFRDTLNPEHYIVIPIVSSENRRYIPMGFLDGNTIPTNQVQLVPDADIYSFGILESNVHMAWMRAVCGRLKSDYRYTAKIVYNNFPWPNPTPEQKQKIELTAQGILDSRALFPNSNLADLYDPITMPAELQKAHTENDRAVMQAYGFSVKNMSESDCVAELMKMYKNIVSQEI